MIIFPKSDELVERAKFKKIITFWRLVAGALIIYLLFVNSNKNMGVVSSDHIARIKVDKEIIYDLEKIKKLSIIKDSGNVKALILHINSPGGTMGGSEAIYEILNRISKKVPIVAVMGEVAASGGYLISLPASRIFCLRGTLTGSIGVIMQSFEITEMAKKLGINLVTVKSGELKATPSMLEKPSQNVLKDAQLKVNSVFDIFLRLVKAHRKLNEQQVKRIADGSAFTGEQALELGLVDQIGNEEDALEWLKNNKKIDYKIIDYPLESEHDKFMHYFDQFNQKLKSTIFNIFYTLKLI